MADHRPESESPTIQNLISNLRSTFFATDFENAANKLLSREENLKKEVNNLKKKHENELKIKQTEIDEMKKKNSELELKVRVSEKRYLDLNDRVLSLEKLSKELMSQQEKKSSPRVPAAAPAVENSRQPLVSEKGDSNIKIEAKSPEIIQLDDDDDDDDRECISILKKTNVSNKRKKVFSNDDGDDDTEGNVVFKRRHVSKEIKRDSDEDFFDKIPSGAQKSENLDELHSEPVCSRPLSPPSSARNKPFLEKHEPKTPVFSCDSDNSNSDEDIEKVDDAYAFLSAKLQKERWKSEAHMLNEFEKDDDLCLNAICTIKRQNITLHGSDISRANMLARRLINGDPQGRLNKKAAELSQDDLDYCRMCARKYVTQFFKVYQTKKDPFFPPRTI